MTPGAIYAEEIINAIEKAEGLVLVCSRSAMMPGIMRCEFNILRCVEDVV